jgi:hypothetical protein
MPITSLHDLEDNCCCSSPDLRSAGSILADQQTRFHDGDPDMLANLHYVKELDCGVRKRSSAATPHALPS